MEILSTECPFYRTFQQANGHCLLLGHFVSLAKTLDMDEFLAMLEICYKLSLCRFIAQGY